MTVAKSGEFFARNAEQNAEHNGVRCISGVGINRYGILCAGFENR